MTATSSSSSSSCCSSSTKTSASVGVILSNTEAIRTFLTSSSTQNSNLPEDLRQSALSLSSQPSLPYHSLRSIWVGSNPATRPPLSSLLTGSSFLFTSPKPREKSEELKARLKKLEELAEKKAYAELVKDITPKKQPDEPFSSYKDQLGFAACVAANLLAILSGYVSQASPALMPRLEKAGLHVAVTMFTGYLVGYIAFRALFSRNPVMSAAGGIVGLVCGMLVETLLFIIRTSDYNDRTSTSSSTSNLKIKKNQ